jgi:hypothetical protein
MALETDIKTVRDYLMTKALATWTGVTMTHEVPKKVVAPPSGYIRQMNPTFESETVGSDVATLTFMIVGKWASLTDNQRIDYASQIRTAILADKYSGGPGYMPMCEQFEAFDNENYLDPTTEVGVLFMCKVNVPR